MIAYTHIRPPGWIAHSAESNVLLHHLPLHVVLNGTLQQLFHYWSPRFTLNITVILCTSGNMVVTVLVMELFRVTLNSVSLITHQPLRSISWLYNRACPVFHTQLCDLLNLVGEGAGCRHRYLSRQSPTVWLCVGSCLTVGASAYRTSRTSIGVAPHRISTFLPFVRLMAALRKAERGDAITLKPKSRRLQVKKD